MSRRIAIRPQAGRDLIDLATFIAADRPSAADRFLNSFEATCQLLCSSPTYGSSCAVSDATMVGLRLCTILRFRSCLILYRPSDLEIEIVRVFHGVRDLDAVLAEIE